MQIIHYLFWLFALLNIIGEWTGFLPLRFATKPLLMILLGLWFFRATIANRTTTHQLILAALAFSWAGDMLLMGKTELFFLLGLVSFLIAHVLYILGFVKEIKKSEGKSLLMKNPLFALPIVALFAGLIWMLFSHIPGDMKIPVIVYASVITLMAVMALNRHHAVSSESFLLVFAGAMLFMFSDSIIALNKFYFNDQLWKASFFIMLLYISGQYLIARGTAKTA